MAERFNISGDNGVEILALNIPFQIDAAEFDAINQTIAAALDGKTHLPWVLELSNLEYSGSAVLGLMVNIRQRIKHGGGRLALCGMSPRLSEIFHTCSLDRLFVIAPSRVLASKAVR